MSNHMDLIEGTVTADFIKILRKASTFFVQIIQKDRKAHVTLGKKIKDADFGDDVEVRINVNGFEGYISQMGKDRSYSEAIFSNSGIQYSGEFQALALLLRPGDQITFYASDNRNAYLEKAVITKDSWPKEHQTTHQDYHGLHHDQLTVTVMRKGKRLIDKFFLLGTICPENTCRCIR